MRQLLYLFKLKSKAYFKRDNWKRWALEGFFLLIISFYCIMGAMALGFGLLPGHANTKMANPPIDLQPFFSGLAMFLLFCPLFFKFFPSFSLKKNTIPAFYPLSRWQIASLDLWGLSIYKTMNGVLLFGICLFSICLYLVTGLEPWLAGRAFLLFLGCYSCGVLLGENLMNAIAWRKWIYLGLIFLLAFFIFYYLNSSYHSLNNGLPLVAVYFSLLLLVSLYYGFYQIHTELPRRNVRVSKKMDHYGQKTSWHMLWRNKTYRVTLLMGITFHGIFLNYFLIKLSSSGSADIFTTHLSNVSAMLFFATPITLFTYVYGNFWGFFEQQLRNLIIIGASKENTRMVFRQILLPPLFIYELAVLINIGIFGLWNAPLLIFHFVAVFYCLSISLLCSYLIFKRVQPVGFMQMKQNSSLITTISILLPLIIVGATYPFQEVFYYGIGGLALITLGVYGWMFKKYTGKLIPTVKSSIFGGE